MFFKKQIKKRKVRFIAVFLLITIVNQIFAPSIAFALTSGPTSPEATSFEPIDTTDMVDPLTGDFTYNLPLLEVPGPEGGYPLSLSYHAGIQPNEDASWVGLGWTLNPGALTRNVNGFPDEWFGTNGSRRDYWVGGTRRTYEIGATIGISGTAGVSVGLAFSQDTYRGFGIGMNLGAQIGLSKYLNASVGVGVSPYGDPYMSAGISGVLGLGGGVSGSLGLGISTNFESISANVNGGVSYSGSMNNGKSTSLMGASIASDGTNPSFSVGGASISTANSNAGNISTSSSGFSLSIPILPLLSINLGASKIRYWSDETMNSTITGSIGSPVLGDNSAYDSYGLLDEDVNVETDPDPSNQQGGTYPDFDVYTVTAQGLSGNIRPYRYQSFVAAQARWNNENVNLVQYHLPANWLSEQRAQFRFINDFSNSYTQKYQDYPDINADLLQAQPPFDKNPVHDNNGGSLVLDPHSKLAGSKDIRYYVVAADGSILNPDGFIKPTVAGLNRALHAGSSMYHIAGFAITNSNGVTYHYNLPAYSYGEEIYQGKNDGSAYNRQTRNEGYAYTWYLTSITGADYVDRNGDQKVNDGDWGYWMNFEYGKWSDDYVWRNPGQGYHVDEDNLFRRVSMGKKEIYYLNAIRTRSHIAMFEKDVRLDGKGATPDAFRKTNEGNYLYAGGFDQNSGKSLRLDKVYLFNIADAAVVNEASSGSGFFANVLDRTDIETVGRSTVESKAVRIIDFNYDYGLCKGTANSFNSLELGEKGGKLTLNSLNFRGVGGANLAPPVEFDYGLSGDRLKTASGTFTSGPFAEKNHTFVSANSTFEVGDMLEVDDPGAMFSGVIVAKEQSGGTYTYKIKNSTLFSSVPVVKQLRTTKNPPYNKDAYDIWGLYKSDYVYSLNENLSRRTSRVSNYGTDAWSLRRIKTSMGSEITVDYEGDTYNKSVLNDNSSMIISSFSKINETSWLLDINTGENDLREIFKVGDEIDFPFLVSYAVFPSSQLNYEAKKASDFSAGGPLPYVESVNTNQIQIRTNPDLMKYLNIGAANHLFHRLLTGNLPVKSASQNYGGGLRVKSLTTNSLLSTSYSTNYSYQKPENNLLSSGVTPYEPIILEADDAGRYGAEASAKYRLHLYKRINNLYKISRELPAPGVMYEYVTVESDVRHQGSSIPIKNEGKTTYKYEVFRSNMIGRVEASPARYAWVAGRGQYTKNWVLKNFVSSLGALKKIIRYDVNNVKLSETTNNYLHDGLEDLPLADFMVQYEQRLARFGNQGLIKERFAEIKQIREANTNYTIRATTSARELFPVVPLGQSSIDYITGVVTGTENIAFDFYSGAVTQVATNDAYGNRFLTVTEPAYKKYSAMGLKSLSTSNKNMLTQEALRTTYQVNSANSYLGVASASAQTWANDIRTDDESNTITTVGQSGIWRLKGNFQWKKTGTSANNLTPIAAFVPFKHFGVNDASWLKMGEITRYNVFSVGLEGTDMNSHYTSKRMGYKNSKVVIAAAPARYGEIAYAGAEDPLISAGRLSTGVSLGAGLVSSIMAHTGSKSISLAAGTTGATYQVSFADLDPIRRDYQASVWVKSTGDVSKARLFYQIDNQTAVLNTPSFLKVAGGWYLLELRIPASALASGSSITVGCKNIGTAAIHFDDFRFQPLNAPAISYVYNNVTGELTYSLDNNNLFVKYDYDAIGRLIKISREVLGKAITPIAKEISYNYAKPLAVIVNSVPFYARLELDNYADVSFGGNDDYGNEITADVFIRFYSDINCTVRFPLRNSLTFDVNNAFSYSDMYGQGSSTNSNYYVGQKGTTEFSIGRHLFTNNRTVLENGYYNHMTNQSDLILVPFAASPYTPLANFINGN